MSDAFLAMLNSFDTEKREGFVRPPINYMGSKFDSLNRLLPLLPVKNTWVDVFGGSGVVTLNRPPSRLDVYNDRWGGLTAIYKCVADTNKLDELITRLSLAPHSREFFIWCKETVDNPDDDVTRAFKAYYLIQMSFAGRAEYFGRVVKGTSNIHKKLSKSLKGFYTIHDRFKQVQIENLDWKVCVKDFDGYDTVHYMDPPYFGSSVYRFSIDHHDLCQTIFGLKGFVALSGYDNPIYNSYQWDHVYHWPVSTDVATMATTEGATMENATVLNRNAREEFLWIKEAK